MFSEAWLSCLRKMSHMVFTLSQDVMHPYESTEQRMFQKVQALGNRGMEFGKGAR